MSELKYKQNLSLILQRLNHFESLSNDGILFTKDIAKLIVRVERMLKDN
jgi:hypothetical protein